MPYANFDLRSLHRRQYYLRNRAALLERGKQWAAAHPECNRTAAKKRRSAPVTSIYALTDPSGEVRYIGKTVGNVQVRFEEHIRRASRGKDFTHRSNWIRSLLRNELQPGIIILRTCEGTGAVEEQEEIARAAESGVRLTNLTAGGDGATGFIPTEKTRSKLSKALKGRKNGPRPQWVRDLISQSHKGRKLSPEHLAACRRFLACRTPEQRAAWADKISATKTGKSIWSAEQRAEISKRQKGRRLSDEAKAKLSIAHKTSSKAIAARALFTPKAVEAMRRANLGTKQSPEVVAKRMASRAATIASKKADQPTLF